ncbi:MAG: glutathione S-transferase family protein [Pseudohongiellaceae bacterium]
MNITVTDPPLLTYFDVRGRAEPVRLMLEFLTLPYREKRVAVEEWPALKTTLPLGQLPIYEEGDLCIYQSHAIYRYLARKHDLYGSTEAERIRCDMIEEFCVDAINSVGTLFWNPQFSTVRGEYEKITLPMMLERMDYLARQNDSASGFLVGNKASFVDFLGWHYLDYVRALSPPALDKFPALMKFKHHIQSLPAIKAYLASPRRPATFTVAMAFFGNSPENS